ncbi:40123_t:CDS:2 [Gigaspora margarita]|uniref:40123_t:CDS:1 n=1 Tax=Gigaspora margarita TaxID=4874 RepID=A0ABM8W6D6_GIGMA|nr:40123_t:CDS:2 [Gigaspora margarita]
MDVDFSISINGCFAVSKNRRNLEVSTSEDLGSDDLLLRKWNKYLFENVIPIVLKKFFLPIFPKFGYETLSMGQNVVNRLNVNLKVFRGTLAIDDGYFSDKIFKKSPDLVKLMAKLEFPVFVDTPKSIIGKLE